MLDQDGFRSLSTLGRALWADPNQSVRITREALTATALLPLNSETYLERAANILVLRSRTQNASPSPYGVENPFFRLSPEERFVLVALHTEGWSYSRIARVLGPSSSKIDVREVARRAWQARLRLAQVSTVEKAIHPTGSTKQSTSCPEYDSLQPWTQRFLDREASPLEKVFIQNHILGCDSCRQSLARCRALYYSVEILIPRATQLLPSPEEVTQLKTEVDRVLSQIDPTRVGFSQSLRNFSGRRDIQAALGALAILMLIAVLRNLR